MTRVGIMGAGAIGCYVGGRLAAAGADVTLVGRESLAREVAAHGLRITDFRGFDAIVKNVAFVTTTEPLRDMDVVIVTVKSLDTRATGQALAKVLNRDKTTVVSLQNGVRNPALLREGLNDVRVLTAMVPFNVVRKEPATFHSGTSGHIVIEQSELPAAKALVALLSAASIDVHVRRDVEAVQWGKLVINLSNAVNALSGVTIHAMLSSRDYRRVMADVVAEAVAVLTAARIPTVLNVPLPAWCMPHVLRLPDPVFRLAAKSMLTVDPEARASMWDDLTRRRATEIDYLNGEIVALAQKHGRYAPVNTEIVRLVRQAESARLGSPEMPAAMMRAGFGLNP